MKEIYGKCSLQEQGIVPEKVHWEGRLMEGPNHRGVASRWCVIG